MKDYNKQILILILNILSINLFCQKGYYFSDSTSSYGIYIVDGGARSNSKICQVKQKDRIVIFTPDELKEYGFENGKTYISKKIQINDSNQQVFLERVFSGKINLYYYKGQQSFTYFIEKDSSFLIELSKKKDSINFRNSLSDLTHDCKNLVDASRLVTYKRATLVKYLKRYNSCKLNPFPFFKYGFILGYEISKLVTSSSMKFEELYLFDYKYDGGITIGLFIDYPIMVSDFSLHAETYFSSHGYSYNKSSPRRDLDVLINTASLNVPVLIRYTLPILKIRPFIDLGGMYSFNLMNENALYSSTIDDDIIYIDGVTGSSLISDHEIVYSMGCGIQWNINYRNSIFFQFRYNDMVHKSNQESFGKRQIQIQTGYNF
jgi:hypothetical protein